MRAAVTGLGLHLPDTIRDNGAWPSDFREAFERRGRHEFTDIDASGADEAARIVARHVAPELGDPFMGTVRRRVAASGDTAVFAETRAAEQALADAGVDADEVDAIVSWAVVPDRLLPTGANAVAHALGAKRAFGVGMDAGCASPVTQLLFAASMIESGRARHVLLTQSHLMTRAFPLGHPASPNVGDAATAMVVSASERPGVLGIHAVTHGEHYESVTWTRGRGADSPWWEAGGPFHLGSHDPDAARQLVRDTVGIARDTVHEVLAKSRVSIGEICALASVQPRRWIPAAIAEASGLDPALAPDTFVELAHLGGAGVLANLVEARRRGLLAPREDGRALVVLYAQGAGFIRSAAVIDMAAGASVSSRA